MSFSDLPPGEKDRILVVAYLGTVAQGILQQQPTFFSRRKTGVPWREHRPRYDPEVVQVMVEHCGIGGLGPLLIRQGLTPEEAAAVNAHLAQRLIEALTLLEPSEDSS